MHAIVTTLRTTTHWALAVVLLTASAFALAGEPAPILPDRGLYYEPGHGGTGLAVDVDPNGFLFAIFFTYQPDGSPTYYLMQGPFQPAANIAAGSPEGGTGIGSFDATLYTSTGGECLGEGCTYQSPSRTLTERHAHIDWITQRHALLSIGSQSWDLWAGQYTSADGDKLVGTWSATLEAGSAPDIQGSTQVALLKSRETTIPSSAFDDTPGYTTSAHYYDLACAGPDDDNWDMQAVCPDFYAALAKAYGVDGDAGLRYLLVYDTADGSLALWPVDIVDGTVRFKQNPYDFLYFQFELAPGVLRGRQIHWSDGFGLRQTAGSMNMLRIADGSYAAPPH